MVRLSLAYSTPLTVATMSSVESGPCRYRLLKVLSIDSESENARVLTSPCESIAAMLLPSVPTATFEPLRRLGGAYTTPASPGE